MEILDLIEEIRKTPDCVVFPALGLPLIPPEHQLPDDVREFYTTCGGVTLFENSAYTLTIVPPQCVVVANPVIVIGVSPHQLIKMMHPTSWSWYIIGQGENAQYITIDFSRERLGRCYNSFWEVHPSNPEIIALSFTELLEKLLSNQDEEWFWHKSDFKSLGYAYIEP